MNRKKFLTTVSTGVLAASLLPLLSFTKKRTSISSKSTFKSKNQTNINSKMWDFEFSIGNGLISNFNNTNKDDRKITIYAFDSEDEEVKLVYIATSMKEKMVDAKEYQYFKCELDKNDITKDAKEFADESFGKNIIIEVHWKCHAVVKDNKSKLSVSFQYTATEDSDMDCFLTSACVFHKGLADDCKELTTLRNLRGAKMNPNPQYQKLITEYEIIAPEMLVNINKAENKNEILEVIYTQLVLPSVALVDEGRDEEAIQYYAGFVQEMKALYL